MQRHVQYREPNGNGHALDALLLGPKKIVVRWTQAEQKLIAQKLAELVASKPYTRTFMKAVDIAQDILITEGRMTEDRRRKIARPAAAKNLVTLTKEILKRRAEDAKDVVQARNILKSHQKPVTKENVLDTLTDEEVTVYFQARVMANTSAAELLKYFPVHDLLANLPTAAILSAATFRMAEQTAQQTAAILQVASLVAKMNPDAEKPKTKPLIQIAGINLKRMDEVCEALSDVCYVQRIDPAHLSPSCIREDAKCIVLWSNQLKNPDKNTIRMFAYRKNLAPHQVVEKGGSLESVIEVARQLALK